MEEKFMSKYCIDYRFHLHIGEFSIIMLDPEYYNYLYEIYNLESEEIVGRYNTIIEVIDVIKSLSNSSSAKAESFNKSYEVNQK